LLKEGDMRLPLATALAVVTIVMAGGALPARANHEREQAVLAALAICDRAYSSEPYAVYVLERDVAGLDRAYGAVHAYIARTYRVHESQQLVVSSDNEARRWMPRAGHGASAVVGSCRRIVEGAINAYR
jgi:hypothetical protein